MRATGNNTGMLNSEAQNSTRILKKLLIEVLENKIPSEDKLNNLLVLSTQVNEEMPFDEIPEDEIIYLLVPFIFGTSVKDRVNLINFIRNTIKIGVFESENSAVFLPDGVSVTKRIDKCNIEQKFDPGKVLSDILDGNFDRSDKIYMNNAVKNFNLEYIEWDDRDFMKDILKTCVYKSLLLLRSMITEDNVIQFKDDDEPAKPMQAYKLMSCGHLNPIIPVSDEVTRKDLLKRRFNPTQTIDEYVDNLLEKQATGKQSTPKNKNEKSLEDLRKQDDENDRTSGFRGNTKNVG